MYHILKVLCNMSPKTRDLFIEKNVNFCLTNAEGAIILKNATFEIIIL